MVNRRYMALSADDRQLADEIYDGLREALSVTDDIRPETIDDSELVPIYENLFNNIVSIDPTQSLRQDVVRLMLDKSFLKRFGRLPARQPRP